MQRKRGAHRLLARRSIVTFTGSRPFCGLAPEQCREKRRCGDRPAIAHSRKAKQIDVAGDRLHAERHGSRTAALVQRRFARDVADRQVQGEIEHLEPEIGGDAGLTDDRSAGSDELDSVGGGRRRRRHAMRAGEDRHQRPCDQRREPPAPGRKPGRHVRKFPERSLPGGRPGEHASRPRRRIFVRRRKRGEQIAYIVEGKRAGRHETVSCLACA